VRWRGRGRIYFFFFRENILDSRWSREKVVGEMEGEGEGRGKAFYPGEYSGYEMGQIRLYISQEKMLMRIHKVFTSKIVS
jgi:hypothetical protein